MKNGASISGLSMDLKTGLAFLTCVPLARTEPPSGTGLARAAWTFPLAGALIGAFAALVYWLCYIVGLHPFVAALLTVGVTLTLTGGLHEDGLADTADGFGGGRTRERKLEIMRDSRTGAFGVAALVLSLLLRAGAIASLADPVLVAPALVAAHAGARTLLPVFMWLVPPARQDGLAAGAGRPPRASVIGAALLGLIALVACLGPVTGLIALVLLTAATGIMAWLCRRQIGGQTGDVVGAVEQIGEVLILLTASVRL